MTYPFGSVTPGRSFSSGSYRYGFNKQEKDDEVFGSNVYDFGARIYDARLARWWALDKLKDRYAPISPYTFGLDNPNYFVDHAGKIIIDKNGNTVVLTRDDKGNITGISATNSKGEKVDADPFTVKMITAVGKTDIGRERLKQMEVHSDQFQYKRDRLGTETGDDFGQTNTETKNGKTTHTMWIDDGQERVGTRFEGASDEEFLNAVGVHESSHKLNPDQVALDTKLATNIDDKSTETYDYLNEKGTKPVEEAGQFKINNYETAALKDELKSREQFNGNTLNNNIGGKAGDTPKSRYEKAINSPKSKDLTK